MVRPFKKNTQRMFSRLLMKAKAADLGREIKIAHYIKDENKKMEFIERSREAMK